MSDADGVDTDQRSASITAFKICRVAEPKRGANFRMPWTSNYFPASMRRLSPAIREKAIEIANALLEEGMDEGTAIRIAISKAKEWARRHGLAN